VAHKPRALIDNIVLGVFCISAYELFCWFPNQHALSPACRDVICCRLRIFIKRKEQTMKKHVKLVIALCILVSPPTSAQWVQTNRPAVNWGIGWAIDACDSTAAVLSITYGMVFQTLDGGNSWRELDFSDLAEDAIDLSMVDRTHIWACTDEGRIYATRDGGISWTPQFYDTTKAKFFNYIKMFDLNNGVAEGDGPSTAPALLLKTTDGGDHWTSVPNFLPGLSGDTWHRIDFVNPEVGYFFVSGYGPQALFKTTNGGVTWSETNYPPYVTGYPPYAQVIRFYNERIGLAIPGEGMVFRTVDGGTNWELLTSPHTGWGNDIEFVPGNPAKVWMTDWRMDDSKLYFSTDTGRIWTAELPVGWGRDIIFVNDRYGWFLGDKGVLYRTITGGLAGVSHPGAPVQPETFSLQQNYPNPFNPTTTIEFSLPHSGYVTLKIFDLLGAEVATVVARELTAGSHRVDWNAADFPSGVYFYRVIAGSLVQTKKMVLMK
jgi:photosystem II stability/assembly factor-like uncharacterized protein